MRPWGVCPVWRAEPMDLAQKAPLIRGAFCCRVWRCVLCEVVHGMLGGRDKTILSSGLLYEASGGAAMGGMSGLAGRTHGSPSRGILIWVSLVVGELLACFV